MSSWIRTFSCLLLFTFYLLGEAVFRGEVDVVLDPVLSAVGVPTQEQVHLVLAFLVIVDEHLEKLSLFRQHRGRGKLVVVHLAETLVAVDAVPLADLRLRLLEFGIVIAIDLALAVVDAIERRAGYVDMSRLDKRLHVVVEESQKQRLDMASVIVGIGHDDDLPVVDVLDLEIGVETGADGVDQSRYLLVPEERLLVFYVRRVLRLSAQGKDRLVAGIAPLLGRAAGGVALDDEEFVLLIVLARAGGKLFGDVAGADLALEQLTFLSPRILGLDACFHLVGRLLDDGAGFAVMLLEIVGELALDDLVDGIDRLLGAELSLRLAFELEEMLGDPCGKDGHKTFAQTIAIQGVVGTNLLVVDGIGVEAVGERLL